MAHKVNFFFLHWIFNKFSINVTFVIFIIFLNYELKQSYWTKLWTIAIQWNWSLGNQWICPKWDCSDRVTSWSHFTISSVSWIWYHQNRIQELVILIHGLLLGNSETIVWLREPLSKLFLWCFLFPCWWF